MWNRDTDAGTLGPRLLPTPRDCPVHGAVEPHAHEAEPRLRDQLPKADPLVLRSRPDRGTPIQGMLRSRFRAIYDGDTVRVDGVPTLASVEQPGYAPLCG